MYEMAIVNPERTVNSWLTAHPGVEIVVDDLVFQRRNCTGRDEITLTVYGLGLT